MEREICVRERKEGNQGRGEGRDEGDTRARGPPAPHAAQQKTRNLYDRGSESERWVLLQMTHEIRFRIAARREGGREEGGHCVMKEQKNNDMFREVRGRPDMTSTRRERGHEIRKSCR